MQAKWIVVLIIAPLLIIGVAAALIIRSANGTKATAASLVQQHRAQPIIQPQPAPAKRPRMSVALSASLPAIAIPSSRPSTAMGSAPPPPQRDSPAANDPIDPKQIRARAKVVAEKLIDYYNQQRTGDVVEGVKAKSSYKLITVDVKKSDSLLHPIVAVIRIQNDFVVSTEQTSYFHYIVSMFEIKIAPDDTMTGGWACTKGTRKVINEQSIDAGTLKNSVGEETDMTISVQEILEKLPAK